MAFCRKCGAYLEDDGTQYCPNCGADQGAAPARLSAVSRSARRAGKPIWKRWWFWVLVICVIGAIGSRGGIRDTSNRSSGSTERVITAPVSTPRPTVKPANTPKPVQTPRPTATPTPTEAPSPVPAGVTPEFKATMDSYEAFFDEYIAFMKTMSEDPSNTALLMRYASMMLQYSDTMEKLDEIDETKLSPADDAYYLEVMARIDVKLLQATQYIS